MAARPGEQQDSLKQAPLAPRLPKNPLSGFADPIERSPRRLALERGMHCRLDVSDGCYADSMDMHRLTALALLGLTHVSTGCFDPNATGECPSGACDEDGSTGVPGSTGAAAEDASSVGESESESSGTEGPSPDDPTTAESGDDESTSGGDETTGGGEVGSSGGDETTGGVRPASCGNGIVEAGEACDDGDGNSDTLADACRTSCELPACGDTVVDGGEDCDDAAPGCLADCSFDAPDFGEFPEATLVIGQPDFVSGESEAFGFAFRFPNGILTHQGRLYASNGSSSGVYVFESIPDTPGVLPDHVLGRDGVGGPARPFGPNSIGSFSRGITTDGTRFGIADRSVPRVLLYDAAPVENSEPDVVIGQPDLETNGTGLAPNRFAGETRDMMIANDRMIVSDFDGHRVLVWNSIPTVDDTPADLVLGQADFDQGAANRGGERSAGTFNGPFGVWTDGDRVAIADHRNNRVLLWNTFPTESGQPADVILGQPDAVSGASAEGATGLHNPVDVVFAGNRLYVSDQLNHRVLYYEGWPQSDGAPADGVIGQASLDADQANDDDQDGTNDGNPSARTLARPTMMHFDQGRLYVSDSFNHRYLAFEGA